MKKLYLLYGIVAACGFVLLIIFFTPSYREQTKAVTEATSTDNTNYDEDLSKLATISKYCADYYTSTGQVSDLSDFTTARPLSHYTCGDYSSVETMNLSNGVHLYFVAVNTLMDCGSGGCGHIPLLEVAPGSVKRIRGFNTYSDSGSEPITPQYSGDADGSVFGFLTFESKKNLVIAYYHKNATCGTENIYQISDGSPILAGAYDTCPAGKPITLYVNLNLPITLTSYINVGTFSG